VLTIRMGSVPVDIDATTVDVQGLQAGLRQRLLRSPGPSPLAGLSANEPNCATGGLAQRRREVRPIHHAAAHITYAPSTLASLHTT
jgi:hypothetical protein